MMIFDYISIEKYIHISSPFPGRGQAAMGMSSLSRSGHGRVAESKSAAVCSMAEGVSKSSMADDKCFVVRADLLVETIGI